MRRPQDKNNLTVSLSKPFPERFLSRNGVVKLGLFLGVMEGSQGCGSSLRFGKGEKPSTDNKHLLHDVQLWHSTLELWRVDGRS